MKTKIVLLLIFIATTYGGEVKNVRQNFKDKANMAINKQIQKELQASYFYQAYSYYFSRGDVALPGFAKLFATASASEKDHANKLMDYLNKRGAGILLDDIELQDVCNLVTRGLLDTTFGFTSDKACICNYMSNSAKTTDQCATSRTDWFNGLMALEDMLVLERYVNADYLNMHKKKSDGDPHFANELESEYLPKKVDRIKSTADKITLLKLAKKGLGEYLFDLELQ